MREMDRRRESATGTTVRLKPITVTGGTGAYDRMAEDVASIIDAERALADALKEIGRKLNEILSAIESVPDEMEKTVLTLRYIEGMDWVSISEKIGYEISNTYVLHGRALMAVNEWMKDQAKSL